MIKHNQAGAAAGETVSLILTVILLLAAIGFGVWAFASRQDYKNNTDSKINAAVTAAVAQNSVAKDKQFAEESKNPLTTYNGPEALGSLVMQYPKTWSVYDNSPSGGNGIDLYFNPVKIPAIGNTQTVYALHVQILNQAYASVVQGFDGAAQATFTAYSLPKLPKVIGVKGTGTFPDGSTGTMIIMPIRSQTLEVQTDTSAYLSDFNNYILKNLSFSP